MILLPLREKVSGGARRMWGIGAGVRDWPNAMEWWRRTLIRPASRATFSRKGRRRLPHLAAEALDAGAGVFEQGVGGRVADAEVGREAEGRAEHHRDPLGLQELGGEVLVRADGLARRGGLAQQAFARRIDVKRALRGRTAQPTRLVQHRDNQVA